MEINPYESRLRMLQQMDGVQLQREAAPDDETAGCPGCPYFWTCPVPHKGEEVRAPQEIELEDVREQLGGGEYRPRDESDIGWTDVWIEDDDDESEDEFEPKASDDADDADDPDDADDQHGPHDNPSPAAHGRRARERRSLFRRRRR